MEVVPLNEAQTTLIAEFENEFANRFTDEDEVYIKEFNTEPDPPPVVEPWYNKPRRNFDYNRRDNRRGDGDRYNQRRGRDRYGGDRYGGGGNNRRRSRSRTRSRSRDRYSNQRNERNDRNEYRREDRGRHDLGGRYGGRRSQH